MNRLFRRFFILVMLSITAATLLIYLASRWLFGDPLDDIARRQSSAQIFVLTQYVDQAPADEWLVRLNKVREVSKVRMDIVPLAAARAAASGTMSMRTFDTSRTLFRRTSHSSAGAWSTYCVSTKICADD